MRLIATVVVMVSLAGCSSPDAPPAEAENLVILSIDTLRADHLGCYGYDRSTSPNLDRFAGRGAVFEQAFTVHVSTAPAHATVLTGLEPAGHGIRRNGMRLGPGVRTLAETFADRGWATGGFVSGWTLERHTGLDRGFSVYDDELDAPGAGARRAGDLTTDRAIAWLEQQAADGRPSFLFLHLFEPHWPYDPPATDALGFLSGQYELATVSKPVHIDRLISVNRLDLFEQREYVARYDGEIVVADRLLGRLLDALEDLGVAGSTVVIVLSDHGETLFEREWTMDHGARPFDEQARVPLILHLPDGRLAGRRIPQQVSLLDVTATVADIFGIEPPAGSQGASLLPLALGEVVDEDARAVFTTARCEPQRVPHITEPLRRGALVRAVRVPRLKLVQYPLASDGWHDELYDLSADPGERSNLVSLRPEQAAMLGAALEHWQATAGGALEFGATELDPEVETALRELGYLGD
jgi:arylsulfatase A-like enzyme